MAWLEPLMVGMKKIVKKAAKAQIRGLRPRPINDMPSVTRINPISIP
jgi:hypothetical protein